MATVSAPELRRVSDVRYEIDRSGEMRVPGVVYASDALLPDDGGRTIGQVANVATLPGMVEASYAMPDLHLGYGFPIGGVAATDVAAGGVVSPGGVGFDISCGVRVMTSSFERGEVGGEDLRRLLDALGRAVPRGAGPGGIWHADDAELRRILVAGSEAAVAAGYGTEADLAHTEDGGRLDDADPDVVSAAAVARGLRQVGSLGAGNHFLEVQVVDDVLDAKRADRFGLRTGGITVTIHCGSRGLGHQICSETVKSMQQAMRRHEIAVPDRQLACVPVDSSEGRGYLAAMAAAANYARANRQVLTDATRRVFADVLGSGDLPLVYDVSHNLAKLERHPVGPGGAERLLCVHRKGATRALPPGHPDLPDDYERVGQPVVVPGSMGTSSWVLAGTDRKAFASTCHGAGRALSRKAAKRRVRGGSLRRELAARGIEVRAGSDGGLAEEAPSAYKDVDEVVRVCEQANLSVRVARLRPIGVVKG